MTRNVGMERAAFANATGKSTPKNFSESIYKSTFSALKGFYNKVQNTKKTISSAVVEASEILADRTAKKGLFGEDSGLGYCGTDVDYIPENAIELKYVNLDMTGFDNAYISGGNACRRCARGSRNSSVLKCFNGF